MGVYACWVVECVGRRRAAFLYTLLMYSDDKGIFRIIILPIKRVELKEACQIDISPRLYLRQPREKTGQHKTV